MKPLLRAAFALAPLLSACGNTETNKPEVAAAAPAPATPGQPVVPAPAAPAAATLELASCGSIAKLHALGDVWLASQPTAADFEEAKASGVRSVVNLRPRTEQADFDEEAIVTGLGLAYVNIPISGAQDLSDAIFAQAREQLGKAQRPLLLHCASANRVGAVWIPWRVLDGGIGLDDAVAEAKTIGLKTPELEAKARDYVARMQAAAK